MRRQPRLNRRQHLQLSATSLPGPPTPASWTAREPAGAESLRPHRNHRNTRHTTGSTAKFRCRRCISHQTEQSVRPPAHTTPDRTPPSFKRSRTHQATEAGVTLLGHILPHLTLPHFAPLSPSLHHRPLPCACSFLFAFCLTGFFSIYSSGCTVSPLSASVFFELHGLHSSSRISAFPSLDTPLLRPNLDTFTITITT